MTEQHRLAKLYKVNKAGYLETQTIKAKSPEDAVRKLFMVNTYIYKERFGVWILDDRRVNVDQLYSVELADEKE